MAEEVVGRAYVDILPRLDKFGPAVKAGVKPALADVDSGVKKTATNAETSFRRAGTAAGLAFKPASAGIKKVETDAKASTSKIKKYFGDTAHELNGSFTRIAAGAAIGTAVFSFLKSSTTAASDLNETTSKTATVFGDASAAVFAFAKTSATSLGQSTQQAEEAVATYGNLLEGFKIAPKLAADMSIQLDKLASDFASFHNANPADVIESLTAAFRGEFDPVQKFVPTINAATVQLEALKETGKKNASSLTLQEKALATYNILLKGAGPALGDFARTSGGAANQGRILAAQFQNLKVSVGNVLLPALTFTFRTLNAGITTLQNSGDAIQKFGAPAVTVAHALGDAFQFLGQHKSAVIGIGVALGTVYVGLKLISGVKTTFNAIVSGLETLYLKALYAGDGVQSLGGKMSATKIASAGLNAGLLVAAIGVGIWAQKHAKAKQEVAEHQGRVQSLTSALTANKGAVDQSVRSMVIQQAEERGLLKQAGELGINVGTYTQALLGNKGAQESVTQTLRDKAAAGQLDILTVGDFIGKTTEQSTVLGDAQSAYGRVTEATGAATTATNTNTGAQQRAAKAAQDETDKQNKLYDSLTQLANVNLSAAQTHLQFQAALLAVDTSLHGLDRTTRSQTLSLSANTVAGNQARQTLVSNVQAAVADSEAQKARGVSTAKATATLQSDIGALRQHYLRLGYSKQAVDQVIASLGVLGQKHATPTVTVHTDAARAQIAALKRQLDILNGRRISTYVENFITNRTTAVGGGELGGATGGVVGQSLGYRQAVDTELVWAQPGEGLVVPRAVKMLGGPAGIAQLNRGRLPALATGGGGGGGPQVTLAPGAVQVHVDASGNADAGALEAAVRHAVDDALASLVTRLKAGGRR